MAKANLVALKEYRLKIYFLAFKISYRTCFPFVELYIIQIRYYIYLLYFHNYFKKNIQKIYILNKLQKSKLKKTSNDN